MPAQAAIIINDGKATPVAHTYNVFGAVSEGGEVVAKWINRTASALTGGAEMLVSYFRPKKDGAMGIRFSLVMPITESVSGVNVVTRTLKATITFDIPANATSAERKDLRTLLKNWQADGQFANVIDNGEPAY